MDLSKEEVDKGLVTIDETKEAFMAIIGSIDEISKQIQSISEAINQVAKGTEDVVSSVNSIEGCPRRYQEIFKMFQRQQKNKQHLWRR